MKHSGSCHCGQVKIEVEMSIERGLSCNCSICRKKGTILAFVPESAFRLVSGEASLKDYQFGAKRIHHYFCSNCGVSAFGAGQMPDGSAVRSVNLRCLDGIDLETLEIDHFDGRSL